MSTYKHKLWVAWILGGNLGLFVVALAAGYLIDAHFGNNYLKSFPVSFAASMCAAFLFGIITYSLVDSKLEQERKSELRAFVNGLEIRERFFVKDVRPRGTDGTDDENFWEAFIARANDNLILTGHTFDKWRTAAAKQKLLIEHIPRILNGGGEVNILFTEPVLKGDMKNPKKKQQIVLFLDEIREIQSKVKNNKKRSKLIVKQLAWNKDFQKEIHYVFNKADDRILISPYMVSREEHSNSVVVTFDKKSKCAGAYKAEFDKLWKDHALEILVDESVTKIIYAEQDQTTTLF